MILIPGHAERGPIMFRSRKRGEPCRTCWMTDGVWRIDVQESDSSNEEG